MFRGKNKYLFIGTICLLLFIVWTMLVKLTDVKNVGPTGSAVGFSTLNVMFHNLTGTNMRFYILTDLLSIVPLIFVFIFGIIGIIQWIKRKHILKVDYEIITLGVFYIILLLTYILFEIVVINYRPILIDSRLEVSYPSSTTMLVMCVIPTSIIQFNKLISNKKGKMCITISLTSFTFILVLLRVLSGVHWLSDIIGGILLSSGYFFIYYYILKIK